VEYPSEALREALERTLGVPIFQEQVMQIAMVAAGFSAGEADQPAPRHGRLEAQGRRAQVPRPHCRRHGRARLQRAEFAQGIFQQIWASANTAFPRATPPALRCWPG
jgi:error-prone DNA polymerase